MMDRRNLKHYDLTLVACALAIVAYSLLMIYSASKGGDAGTMRVARQIVWAVMGITIMLLISTIDHNAYPRIAGRIYAVNLTLLLAVLLVGKSAKGAQRWLGFGPFSIQPSELAKIALIICLAAFLVSRRDQIRDFPTVVKSFLYMAVPTLLIFKQPDLGTALVLLAIWFGMLYFAGARLRHLAVFVLAGALLFTAMWSFGVLKDYQKKRLVTFINPDVDPKASGYHITQSRIAIGSGKLLGKGYMHGTQSQLRFIPEQHTDFIFTVVGEELGFMGGALLLMLYLGLLYRAAVIMMSAEDPVGRLISGGILSMFLFQTVVNLGMTMGIMPVTGVPLPMFSYGGSSLLACLSAIGILAGIYTRRHKISF
ncbi:MAG: rod shape-determining protein RodA [Armatimonadota bacterium]|nr:rod shape-determining protein RodA [Armatimonadota bacterium]